MLKVPSSLKRKHKFIEKWLQTSDGDYVKLPFSSSLHKYSLLLLQVKFNPGEKKIEKEIYKKDDTIVNSGSMQLLGKQLYTSFKRSQKENVSSSIQGLINPATPGVY